MASPSKERARVAATLKAIQLLKTGDAYSRRALFCHHQAGTTAKGPQWQFNLLKLLLEREFITKQVKSANEIYYRIAPASNGVHELLSLLSRLGNRMAASHLLWPDQHKDVDRDYVPGDDSDTGDDPVKDEDEWAKHNASAGREMRKYEDEEDESGEEEELPSDSDMLAAVLKMNAAMLENIVHMRRQQDEMRQEMKELHDAWTE